MARVVFFGTPRFAQEVLHIVASSHEVVCVVTQPDKPFGRKQELKKSEVKEYALEQGLPILQPQILDVSILKQLEVFQADFFLVVAFGQIFPKSFLDFVPCINIHASILPHLRGASPLQEMILEDQKYFGVTAMRMEQGLDCGDILGIQFLETQVDLGLHGLSSKLAQMGGELASAVLDSYHLLSPIRQNHCDASVCKKIKKEQGLVSFVSAREIFVKFLAFSTWPSIFLENGLKLVRIELVEKDGIFRSGEILDVLDDGVLVGCQRGKIKILEVQPPSKMKMLAKDYLHGKRLKIGDLFC
ncbi:methionyl-tRNA formyltransferase [Helicobacter pametensis]|uniref:methionyl-tRNA formyltransferase n=1 Tax=Helicobacter pametensis TaxID=95149 RepID=UPI0004B29811|nr:methionyl-tRNA formyltransferase [Helicobacter pametensis]